MERLRVLVAEDSLTVRQRLVEVLSADPDIEVVGEAGDGRQAIEMCLALRPSVVTLDMMMPVMSGLAATEYIMAHCPTPILIVSSSLNRGHAFRTFDALSAGAVDVLEKPGGRDPEGEWERRLLARVKLVARVRVITHPRARLPGWKEAAGLGGLAPAPGSAPAEPADGELRLVAIGASTGGPGAVAEILHGLPARFPLPIVVVIHIGPQFARSLVQWLDADSRLRVVEAEDGQPLPPPGAARVFLAPPDRHLVLSGGCLRLTDAPERHSCRPSVDELFDSVAREAGPAAVACLLTGMGRDGAQGLLAVRRAGGRTMAQDEASCVVWGMPREAVNLGAAERVLPARDMAAALVEMASQGGRGRAP